MLIIASRACSLNVNYWLAQFKCGLVTLAVLLEGRVLKPLYILLQIGAKKATNVFPCVSMSTSQICVNLNALASEFSFALLRSISVNGLKIYNFFIILKKDNSQVKCLVTFMTIKAKKRKWNKIYCLPKPDDDDVFSVVFWIESSPSVLMFLDSSFLYALCG